MCLIQSADAAGILDRAIKIIAAAADTPTWQMRAGERWLRKGRQEVEV
uniref:Uncharacterized protein n=1 Tax=Candidatus Methanogaster sp. ANME-2c ERB4 TaxID=2759911 RepID=A0A7G9Y0C6_9EURY|nr:hypothetical protein CIDILJJO_00007 [Methanosarcinales archaeon ANME-2c ERB4]QNO42106.1 hypothetical protein INBEEEIC_00008 [Methanosarcinales archaeon ANME-2c ERB4]QNO42472.1 hypothetical protein LBOOMNCC_00025 [Methanosarcinales archaeon ANME-2c ERB4]QNO42704.1 hypothetical protein AOABALHP_00007 [Methanosarcinales archaeon ANME-2c ERB4]QNO42790.1 hypothetical protein APHJHCDA_00007 [Methanosarcinales archaeon ANME-2c ERB4]